MTLRINKEAGKGSNRRATQDDNAYRNNYDLIFGKKPSVVTLPETVVDGIEQYLKEQDDATEAKNQG